jgi:nucleotide-binding universal stress UspA family protein
VTLKVLHDALCPVWTTTHTEQPAEYRNIAFRNIICAVDVSDKTCPTIKWAGDFAKACDAKLTIEHAVPLVVPTAWDYHFTNLEQEMIDSCRQRIYSMQASLGVGAKVDVVLGEPAPAVRDAAKAAHADLLVIGRTLPDGLVGRLRTHAYPIIRHSPCPVISL